MIVDITAFKNHKLDCFTTPTFIDVEPEKAAAQLVRTIKQGIIDGDRRAYQYRYLEMYHIGTFDDVTGKITQFEEPIAILDCRTIFPEEATDGK